MNQTPMKRRVFAKSSLALAASALAVPSFLRAQALDQVKIFYGFPAGSAGDGVARRVAEKLAGAGYGKAAVVENKPGAGGRIALESLKASAADGSALALSPWSALSVYPHVYSKLSYDPFKDFSTVSIAAIIHHGFAVGPAVPESVKNIKDYLAWAKANADKAVYGSPAAGSTPHFVAALLGISSGTELRHVPYRGSVPGITDLIGGQIPAFCCPAGDMLTNHRAGKLRLLATSGKTRLPGAPEVATFTEQGFGELSVEEWFGFHVPSKTPAAVVAQASAAINAALREKSVIDAISASGLIVRGSTPDEQLASQRAEFERWGPLVKRIGFTADS